LRAASAEDLAALESLWPFWARPDQLAPAGRWRTWLILGGRGAGKTRAGAEWVRGEVEAGRLRRIALVGPTLADVREVMIEGPSGLRALSQSARPSYQPSRRRLVWPNGAIAHAFSAEDPDSLRGPQFDGAWLDELAAWAEAQAVYDMLQLGLRIGASPRQIVTTTPRPIKAIRRLIKSRGVVVTRAGTVANLGALAPGFFESMTAAYASSRLGRQELDGEIIEDIAGALWSRALIESVIAEPDVELERIVVGVDPPAGDSVDADACGVIVAGAAGEGLARRAFVLADRTIQGVRPEAWASRVVETAHAFEADQVVAEVNQGGALVRTVLEVVDPMLPIREVRAVRGKRARAEPIATLYERGRVRHAGRFPALEDEMCAFGAPGTQGSPDRVDALVWALTALMLDDAGPPRLRSL
jgi:phage terminase large subunit-like protein